LTALQSDPGNPVAAYMLFKNRGAAVVRGSLPEQMQAHVGGLTDVAYAVIESMESSQRRDYTKARSKDDLLAQAQPFDQWYLNAAKMRADWRIMAVQRGESSGFSTEALAIIDEVIALNQDVDFYGMRMAAAFLAKDYDAFVETARRMVWLIRQDLKFRTADSGRELSASEISKTLLRLKSMREGLSVVRKMGSVADYKFITIDESITGLQQQIESYAEQ
jgi:hypothetical protein